MKKKLLRAQDELMHCFFVCGRMSTKELLTKTVKGDTVRGLTKKKYNCKYTPSSMFKNWLWNEYLRDKEGFVSMLSACQNFEKLHSDLLESLEKFWSKLDKSMAKKMPFYYFTKMIDLLIKSICRWEELSRKKQMWFFKNAHLPLDQYSLRGLREFELNVNYTIPKNASMGWVDRKKVEDIRDQEQYMEFYHDIQKNVRNTLKPYPPMLFDLHAFDFLRRRSSIDPEDYLLK